MVTQALFYEHIEERLATMEFVCGAVSIRRDSWPGREEAFQWLSKRFPWKMWDSRTVGLFVVSTPRFPTSISILPLLIFIVRSTAYRTLR